MSQEQEIEDILRQELEKLTAPICKAKHFQKRKFKKAFKKFLSSPDGHYNTWLKVQGVEVYVRKSKRNSQNDAWITDIYPSLNTQEIQILDLANVQISRDLQNKGIFKKILFLFESMAKQYKYDGVLVENVLNEVIIPFLSRQNYVPLLSDYPCFVKTIEQ